MIFQLRGKGREELAAALREERSASAGAEEAGHAEAEGAPSDLDQPLEE